MKILITGAFGYTGKGLTAMFEGHHDLRVMSTRSGLETPHELVTGTVSDLDACRRAVDGMDAMVLCHMAVRQTGSYDTPGPAFDANVTGTTNLFYAAREAGIRRVVLVSSCGAVNGYPADTYGTRTLAPRARDDMYSLTKALQEEIAEHYHRAAGMEVAVLRVGWIVDADSCRTKYGDPVSFRETGLVDPRDIGEVARLCCERASLGYEVLYIGGVPAIQEKFDVAYTTRFLDGWKPRHDFGNLPEHQG